MARHASLAEYYRAHPQAFELARELDCTPKEAEAELARRAARARWLQTQQHLQAKMAAPLRHESHEPPADARWMMRD